ncbi:MAG: peptidoglycan-binding protein [Pseudomonadales bacterium]|nr:peptidoglycan-binding protein [Pseudomonadales bacterium]
MPGTAPYRKATSTQALAAGVLAALLAVGGCNATTPTLGGGSNTATGAAAGGTSAGANPQLEHCDTTLGTMAVDEDRDAPWYYRLTTEYKLDSTVPVLRTLIQQSNCFVVVERGAALNNMMMERDLAASGEMRQGSKMGKGQMVAADYTMSPTINFSEKGTGAVGGLLGGALGGVAGVVAGGLKANEASTTLLLIDNRSGVQVSASQGSAKNYDIAGFGGGFFGGVAGLGGYTNTPEGKIIVTAFMDSYNNMVRALRNYKAQSVEGGLGTGGALQVN